MQSTQLNRTHCRRVLHCTMESHPSRDEELENVVDELQDGVTEERRERNVPGNVSERQQTPMAGSEQEPPD